MAWFLATGDEESPQNSNACSTSDWLLYPCQPAVRSGSKPKTSGTWKGFAVEDRKDKEPRTNSTYSPRGVPDASARAFDEPFMPERGRYDAVIRHREEGANRCRYTFFINGVRRGAAWDSALGEGGWTNQI